MNEIEKIKITPYDIKITARVAYIRFCVSAVFQNEEEFEFTFTSAIRKKYILDDYEIYNIVLTELKNEIEKKQITFTDDIANNAVFELYTKTKYFWVFCKINNFDKQTGFLNFEIYGPGIVQTVLIHAADFCTLNNFCTFFKEINLNEKICTVMGVPPRPF